MEQRVLVCGGRDFTDEKMAFSILDLAHAANPIIKLIHGAAAGADMLAAMWAAKRNVQTEAFPADWDTYGKSAGPIRNRKMLDEGKPDMVIAFPGGHGTNNMLAQAEGARVPIILVLPNGKTKSLY